MTTTSRDATARAGRSGETRSPGKKALDMSATGTRGGRSMGARKKAVELGWAALACMGVVFGDIGTSPLYTLNVAAKAASPNGEVTPEAVLGIVSLIFWSLIIVISIKYAILIMRADNHGEGGILALLALVSPRRAKQNARRAALLIVGLIGATLLYGDGTITPAISVLSAIEGLKLYAPQMEHFVVPLTVVILAGLFVIQRNGTSFIGGLFGPVMLVWFIIAGVLGVGGIVRSPAVLAALNPLAAVTYLWSAGPLAFVGDRRRLPRRDGRRSVLRRHGPFRAAADPRRLVRRGAAGADAELFRPGRAPARRAQLSRGARQPVLRARAAMGALSAGPPRDRRDRDRLAVDHLGRLFDDPAGDQPRLPAAHDRHSHRGPRDRADLCAVRQLGARRRDAAAVDRLRLLGRAGRRLRHRGVAADGDHDADGDVRGAALEDQPAHRLCGQRRPARARPAVLRLDLDQARRRRLVPAADRLHDRVPHADVAKGLRGHGHAAGRHPRADAGFHRAPARQPAGPHSAGPPSSWAA